MDVKHETAASSSSVETAGLEKDVAMVGNENSLIKEDDTELRIKDEDKCLEITSPNQENQTTGKEQDNIELESTRVEMDEVRKENQRLKDLLERIQDDYKSLQMRFFDIVRSEPELEKSPSILSEIKSLPNNQTQKEDYYQDHPDISLCLGSKTHKKRKKEDSNTSSTTREDAKLMSDGLCLGLEFKSSPRPIDVSSERSGETINKDAIEDRDGDTWRSTKVVETAKDSADEETSQQSNNNKRARVSVRARCDTPTMSDGCQWRKYGQKIAKGNPCPRAYYRCTVAPSCPVRKQVQRCCDDMSILITTYEGTHNHPLPVAATSMASTTSAAASILLSGSSTSQAGLTSSAPTTMTATSLNGMNFTLYNNSKTSQFNLPSSCSPNTPPTITLDLTSTPSSFFNKSNNFLHSSSSDYSSRSLDFSSSQPNSTFPIGWSNNNNNSYLNYGLLPTNKTSTPIGSISFAKSHLNSSNSSSSSSQQLLTETLTKVLTSDPSFQSAVAAAISTMVGSTTNTNMITANQNHANAESLTQNLQRAQHVHGILTNSLTQNNGNKGCTPTYLNKPTLSTSSSSQTARNFMLLQAPFPFSLTKSSSSSDHKD